MPTVRTKDAIKSMELAKTNMGIVLDRNKTLENALKILISEVRDFKMYVPERAYIYGGKVSLRSKVDDAANDAEKIL